MQLFNNMNVNFMGSRKAAAALSLSLIAVSIVSLFVMGLNFGIDFTGGTLIGATYSKAIDLEMVRKDLADAGFDDAIVKNFGSAEDVDIHIPPSDEYKDNALGAKVLEILKKEDPKVEIRRQDAVGSVVGSELAEKGGEAILMALGAILIYVALRFQLKLSLGAIAALAHDITITLGVFSVFQIDFDLTVLAALLAVIGYSLNDTIVVFDRVRENFRKMRKKGSLEIVNSSINQTFGRTMMTSVTTMLVLLALYFRGGDDINHFALALIIGVVVGTYSSIYVASTTALKLGLSKEDLVVPEKEGFNEEESPEMSYVE
ncbi:MAG: protein translocase subunit SecF [Gammaproteobacteria bacterium]|nr:MAG: protein translocase subunit SecF [Gammaproteobacteria bacterium]